MSVYFTDRQAKALEAKAAQAGITFAEALRRALDEWLAQRSGGTSSMLRESLFPLLEDICDQLDHFLVVEDWPAEEKELWWRLKGIYENLDTVKSELEDETE